MDRTLLRLTCGFAIAWAVCVAMSKPAVVLSQSAQTAIVGARLIDGTGAPPIDDAVVVVNGDRIQRAGPRARVEIPPGADIVEAAGKTLLPGLVDVHCHINQPADDMRRYWLAQLRWGVTTMRSAGNDKPETVPLFRRTRDGTILAPRAYTAGQGFNVSGPYPGAPTFKPTTTAEARGRVHRVRRRFAQRVRRGRPPRSKVAAIRQIGPKHCIASSDLGQKGNALPTVGFGAFVRELQKRGLTARDTDRMTKENPAKLLGLQ